MRILRDGKYHFGWRFRLSGPEPEDPRDGRAVAPGRQDMLAEPDPGSADLEEFHRAFWSDFDAGRLLAVEDYIARFPGLEAEIREEAEWARRSLEIEEDSPASSPLPSGVDAEDGPAGATAEREAGIPERIGKYEVLHRLTKGGMGLLFLARDRDLNRLVVLKTPRWSSASPEAIERLKREAQIGGRLDIDGICQVLDVVTEGDRVFVVMQYIPGETLGEWIRAVRRGAAGPAEPRSLWRSLSRRAAGTTASGTAGESEARRSPTEEEGDVRPVLRLIEHVARAIHEVHEEGIVHRDLKPDNIMIRRKGGKPVVLDLGLALDLSSEAGPRLTREDQIVGTPDYMAPEQIAGDVGEIDRRTDVYALGATLYELLTLRRPFAAGSPQEAYPQILRGDPMPPRKLNRSIPRDLEAVCLRAMDPIPSRRYATALEFAEDLRRVVTLQPTVAKPLTPLGRTLRRARRNPVLTGTIAAAVLLAATTATFLMLWLAAEEKLDQLIPKLSRRLPPDARELYSGILKPIDLLENLEGRVTTIRSGTGEPEERLLSPRATVVGNRPTFLFQVPPPGDRTWHYVLSITVDGAATAWASFHIMQQPGERGPLSFMLPESVRLDPGAYRWSVSLDPEKHAGHEPWSPTPATFRVVASADRRDLLASVRHTGRPVSDRLLRASALIARELAEDAQRELGAEPPAGSTRAETLLYHYLAGLAADLLGDQDGLEKHVDEVRRLIREESRRK